MNIEELKSRLPQLEDIISKLGLSNKPWETGKGNPCIFADEHPNHPCKIRAAIKNGRYYCYSDDSHCGDVFDIVAKQKGLDFAETVKLLKEVFIPDAANSPQKYQFTTGRETEGPHFNKSAHWCAHYRTEAMRNLRRTKGVEVLKKWFPKIGKFDHPICEYIGWEVKTQTPAILIEAIKERKAYWNNVSDYNRPGKDGKWIGLKGRPMIPFPQKLFEDTNEPGDWILVTEGLKDCVNAWLSGFKAITLGGGLVPWDDHLIYLAGKNLVICRDLDDAGLKFQNKLIGTIKNSFHNIPQIYCVDWSELSSKKGYDLSDALVDHPELSMKDLIKLSDTHIDNRDEDEWPTDAKGNPIKPRPSLRIAAFRNKWRIWAGMESQYMYIQSMRTKEIEKLKGPDFWHQLDLRLSQRSSSDQRVKIPQKREIFNPERSERFYYDIERGEYIYNIFEATNLWLLPKEEKLPDLPPLISTLIANILGMPFNSDDWDDSHLALFNHFINWLATFYQTRKTSEIGWIFTGEKGTGKNVFYERVIWPIFGENQCILVGDEDLEDKYSSWQCNKLFVVFNELSQDAQTRHRMKDKIKTLVTESKVRVRKMYSEADHDQRNTFNLMIFTNEANPFKVEKNDRRFNVMAPEVKLEQYREFVDLGNNWTFQESLPALDAEVEQFARHLASRDIDTYWYNKTIDTLAKDEMIARSMTITEKIWWAFVNNDKTFFLENDLIKPDERFIEIGAHTEEQVLEKCFEKKFAPNFVLTTVYYRATGERKTPFGIKNAIRSRGISIPETNNLVRFYTDIIRGASWR